MGHRCSDDKNASIRKKSNGVLFTDGCNDNTLSKIMLLRLVFSILAWCCVLGIVVYLYIGSSKGKEPYHQAKHLKESHSPSYNITSPTKYNSTSDRTNDDEYWKSISRQKELEDIGMDGAANMERNARQEYIRGGGYHSQDGTPQVHFQGSREQAEQLQQMDEMGW